MDRPSSSEARYAPGSSVEHYLDGAIRLRQAATWNTFDANIKGALSQRIIPIVDADVIRLFMAPAEETSYVNPFPSVESNSAARRAWNDPLTLVAAATAEFIFLTDKIEILGQQVGKWNEPLRITSPHLGDVESMLYQIKMKIVKGMQSLAELEDAAIERLDPLLARMHREPDRGLGALVQALPNSLRELYLGPMYEAERWIRLRDDQVLLKLEGLAEATPEILQPDQKLMECWREPLFKSLMRSYVLNRDQGRRSDPEGFRRRAEERAQRDALALASVTALNEAGLEAGADRGWRAILISGDDRLHRVYARWAWETSGASLRPERYVLRRPLQYTPVLNVVSMSKDQSAAEIFTKLTKALDLTVDLLLEQWQGKINPFLLEYHWEHHSKNWLRTLDQEGIEEHLAKCNGYWLEAINHINARNHPYLTRDYQKLFDKLRAAFDEPQAQRELINRTRDVFEEIDAEHFRLVLEETTYELARIETPMRMPFMVRTEFPEFLAANGSIAQFLYGEPESLTMRRHEVAELDALAQSIQNRPGVRATFLTAILAAANGSFIRASRLMTRAQQLADDIVQDDRGLLGEMAYFHALIMRLNVKGRGDYERAHALLQRELSAASGDPLRKARALSEAAALELHWFGTDALAQNAPITTEQKAYLAKGGQQLMAARASLQWPVGPQTSRYERELAQQIIVNVIAHNAYVKLGGDKPDLDMVRWARMQFDASLNRPSGNADYITELWWRAAAWLDGSSAESEEALLEHCTRTLMNFNADEIPVADRNDLKRIQEYIQNGRKAV